MKRATVNIDAYRIRYQNAFSSVTDPYNTTGIEWIAQGEALAKGFEGEATFLLTRGLSFYINGTAGNAKYISHLLPNGSGGTIPNVDYGKRVANTFRHGGSEKTPGAFVSAQNAVCWRFGRWPTGKSQSETYPQARPFSCQTS